MSATREVPKGFVDGSAQLVAALAADPALVARTDAILAEMDAEDRTYAMSLAAVRKAAELTQDDLAKRLGTNQGSISRIEHRRDDLLLSTLLSYLDAAGVRDVELRATVAGRHVTIALDHA